MNAAIKQRTRIILCLLFAFFVSFAITLYLLISDKNHASISMWMFFTLCSLGLLAGNAAVWLMLVSRSRRAERRSTD